MLDPTALLDEFDGSLPIERAATPPSFWYTEPDFLILEREKLLSASWQPVAHTGELERPGDHVASCWMGEPVVVVRGLDQELRGLRNACLHHGAEVARDSGRADRLVCPYHGWTYDLTGRLSTMPRAHDIVGLQPGVDGLAALPLAQTGQIVWTAAGATPPATPPVPAALETLLNETRWERLRHAGRRVYTLRCNWKVYVDNYLDGGYHVAALHRGLGSQLAADSYRTESFDGWALQRVDARATPTTLATTAMTTTTTLTTERQDDSRLDFAERIGAGALYAWLYPNVMLNRYGPFLDTNWVIPRSVDETVVVFDDYYDPEAPEIVGRKADAFLERAFAASNAVQKEDESICESVQRSLASSAFDRGRYAPSLETAMYAFHRRLAADLMSDGCEAAHPAS